MTCNDDLHDSLVDIGEISCPFCNQNLDSNEKPQDRLVKYDLCCESPEIINDNLMLVCRSCGIVKGYETSTEYVDFYENRHKMKRKSVYHRKYTVAHKCKHNNILLKHNKQFSEHNTILSKHNTISSKHNTILSKHNTIFGKHNTKYSRNLCRIYAIIQRINSSLLYR